MFAGLLITFREGLEAFLVVGIVLSYLNRSNLQHLNKWIYLGVFLGLGSAFAAGLLFQVYYSGFESSVGELYLKIGIMGFAVAILTYMVLWMAKNSKNVKGDIERGLDNAISSGSVFALVVMSYLAILREGFETVLFLGAIFGDEMGTQTLYGGAYGLILALVVTTLIFKGMRRVPIKLFFKITGFLILLISAGLLSNMIGIMQDIHMVPTFLPSLFDLSWILVDSSDVGIFFKALFGYTHSPSLMQAASYMGYFGVTIFFSRAIGMALSEKHNLLSDFLCFGKRSQNKVEKVLL